MPHRRYHRYLRVIDGPRHPLVVERPQILQRAAAPSGDEHIRQRVPVGIPYGSCDLRRCLRALYPYRQQQHLGKRIPPPQYAYHVVYRRTRRGRHNGDAPWIYRQRLLVRRVEQSLLPQLLLQLLEGHAQIAHALRRQPGAVQLIRSVSRIHADPPGGDDLHPVFRSEPQPHGAGLEHHALQAALAVLQREIVVPGGVHLIVGYLAPQQHLLQGRHIVQQLLDELVHLRHCEHISSFHRPLLLLPC